MKIKWPDDSERITIIGKNGSGKTQGAVFLLSERSYTKKPWIVFDYKRDELIGDIPNTHTLGLGDKLPKKPGIYIAHPKPGDEDAVEELMWRIWERENVGVYVDEGYMIDKYSRAFQALLTQGRSKRIPMIVLTQRPTGVSRFVLSEADYIQFFQLTDNRDIKTVKEFMPLPIERPLPERYWSYWWDNKRSFRAILKPVPDAESIVSTFRQRLSSPRQRI